MRVRLYWCYDEPVYFYWIKRAVSLVLIISRGFRCLSLCWVIECIEFVVLPCPIGLRFWMRRFVRLIELWIDKAFVVSVFSLSIWHWWRVGSLFMNQVWYGVMPWSKLWCELRKCWFGQYVVYMGLSIPIGNSAIMCGSIFSVIW